MNNKRLIHYKRVRWLFLLRATAFNYSPASEFVILRLIQRSGKTGISGCSQDSLIVVISLSALKIIDRVD